MPNKNSEAPRAVISFIRKLPKSDGTQSPSILERNPPVENINVQVVKKIRIDKLLPIIPTLGKTKPPIKSKAVAISKHTNNL